MVDLPGFLRKSREQIENTKRGERMYLYSGCRECIEKSVLFI